VGILAGATEIDITPEPGCELMGYGARAGASTGVHDPVCARGLALDARNRREGGGGAWLLVSADLCLMAPVQAEELRKRISAGTGLGPGQITIGCSHTHSGPDTGLAAIARGAEPPAHVAAMMAGIERAGLEAWQAREPAALGWARGEARIGRNRRIDPGPIDTGVSVLRVDTATGQPLATLFHHACHGTVLGHDNLEISADWAGVTAREVARQRGGTALFLLGAHADIDPRTRGLMDGLVDGQSVGASFDAVRVLGLEVADAVLGAVDAARPEAEVRVASARAHVELPLCLGELSRGEAERELDSRKQELSDLLALPLDEMPRLAGVVGAAMRRARELPLTDGRRLVSLARLYLRDKSAPFFVSGQRSLDVEAQVSLVGDMALLSLPVEPTTNVGYDWQARVARTIAGGAVTGRVAGIANGWLRYLPHSDDYDHPRAHEHYEVLNALLARGACERLLERAEGLLSDLR